MNKNDQVEMCPIDTLKPHPFNATLYDDTARPEELEGLCESIKTHGVKVPLFITSSHVIISGHRRWEAAKALSLLEVPVIIENPEDIEMAMVEHNRYRKKTIAEVMREAECLMAVEKEKAAIRRASGVADKLGGGSGEEAGKTTTRVAKALGIGSRRTFSKLLKIWDKAKTDPQMAARVKDIDSGDKSIGAVFNTLAPKGKEDMGLDLQIFSTWYFQGIDKTMGMEHPGALPGQIAENLMYYYSPPGGLVVDPFGGGGSTLDAACRMGRRCLISDIKPMRPEIQQWDISQGFIPEAKDCDLIFCDPPYWNMLKKEYTGISTETCAAMSLPDFEDFLEKLIEDAYQILKVGGYLAIIMNLQTYKLPDGVPLIDWPFVCRILMDGAGFTPYQRIVQRLPVSMWNGGQVKHAKDTKRILPTHGDIIIGMKA